MRSSTITKTLQPTAQSNVKNLDFFNDDSDSMYQNQKPRSTMHQPLLLNQTSPVHPSPAAPEKFKNSILDGFAILDSSKMSFPDEARQASLIGRGYASVLQDDLAFFTGLLFLDLSENTLDFAPFGVLPRLKELRLTFNHIKELPGIYGFPKLQYLDLSYNMLTIESINELQHLPCLRELDLCGNNLGGIPRNMKNFKYLEKLTLEQNKIDNNNIFTTLSQMPNLRVVGLAYNFLTRIPAESCADDDCFRLLELLDVSFNYFTTEYDLMPVLNVIRLDKLIIYGNPLLGPKGEDPLFMYVEELYEGSLKARDGYTKKPLEIVTEIPCKRKLRRDQTLGRQAFYQELAVTKVNDVPTFSHNREDYGYATKTLFAEAMDIMNSQRSSSLKENSSSSQPLGHHYKDMTFLTSTEMNADKIMDQVASSMGLKGNNNNSNNNNNNNSTSPLPATRTRSNTKTSMKSNMSTTSSRRRRGDTQRNNNTNGEDIDNDDDDDEEEDAEADARLLKKWEEEEGVSNDDGRGGGGGNRDPLPKQLFNPTIANIDINKESKQPIALTTAIRALRFAISHPLTDFDEVPAKGFLPPHDYAKHNKITHIRQLPRQTYTKKNERQLNAFSTLQASNLQKHDRSSRVKTLQNIDLVLNDLNANTKEMIRPSGWHGGGGNGTGLEMPDNVIARGVARPNTGIKKLVDMVNEVVSDIGAS